MRLGLVIYGSLDTLSGGYLYDRMLVRELRAAGHEVLLFSLPWRSYPAHLLQNCATAFAERIVRARLDILLQDELNHPSLFWLNRSLRRRVPSPIISVVHHLRSQEDHPRPLMPLYRAVERAYLTTLDGCVYNSRTTQASVANLVGHPLPGVVAYPAADHIQPPARASVADLLQRRGASSAPLQLLFVGNVIQRKGLHTLVHALAALPSTHWHLHIAGSTRSDRVYVQRIQQLARTLNLDANLTWHGSIANDGLRSLYSNADILALPSYEGFGIVYLEAMAFGLPVIASTSGAAHEIVFSGKNGYLVAPDAVHTLSRHLAELLANRSQIAVLGYNARQQYERHATWRDSMALALAWLHETKRG